MQYHNKNFLFRVKAILLITFIVLIGIISLVIYGGTITFRSGDITVFVTFFLLLLPVMLHTGLLYSIIIHSYPDKEITKTLKIIFEIISVLAWICFAIISFGLIAWVVVLFGDEQRRNSLSGNVVGIVMLVFSSLLVVMIPIQLIAGYKLITRIRKNHSSILLKSFE